MKEQDWIDMNDEKLWLKTHIHTTESHYGFGIDLYTCMDCGRTAEFAWNIMHTADCPRDEDLKDCKPDCNCIGCKLGYGNKLADQIEYPPCQCPECERGENEIHRNGYRQ